MNKKPVKVKKIILILLILCSSKFVFSQKSIVDAPGLYNSFQWNPNVGNSPIIAPQLWIYSKRRYNVDTVLGIKQQFYFESRYNYEYNNTASFYFGRSFQHQTKQTDTLFREHIIMIGVLGGDTSALSLGYNFSKYNKRFKFETDNQFVYPLLHPEKKFFFDWTKFTHNISCDTTFSVGVSWQLQFFTKPITYIGPMVRLRLHEWLSIDGFCYYDFIKNQWVYAMALDFENK